MSRSTGYQSCFIQGKSLGFKFKSHIQKPRTQITVHRTVILTHVFSFLASTGITPQIKSPPFPFISLPIHYLLMILTSDAVQFDPQTSPIRNLKYGIKCLTLKALYMEMCTSVYMFGVRSLCVPWMCLEIKQRPYRSKTKVRYVTSKVHWPCSCYYNHA
jgi:hypothetical protein